MTPAEEQAEASITRLAALSETMQLAACDEECQAANAMTQLIIIIAIIAICLFFCLLNIWLIWIGKVPFCCCCNCPMGGLFPLASRVKHSKNKIHKNSEKKGAEDDNDVEVGLVENTNQHPFSHVKICSGPVRDG